MEVLSKHRGGLNAIARALLDNEIIDGAEVARLVDEAHGSPVHGEGAKSVPHFHEAALSAPVGNGANGSGNGDVPHAEADAGVDAGVGPRVHGRARRTGAARPPGPSPTRGLPRRGPHRPTPRRAPRRVPQPAEAAANAARGIEPIRPARRHEGGWWSTSSRTGWRTATWRPSAPRA